MVAAEAIRSAAPDTQSGCHIPTPAAKTNNPNAAANPASPSPISSTRQYANPALTSPMKEILLKKKTIEPVEFHPEKPKQFARQKIAQNNYLGGLEWAAAGVIFWSLERISCIILIHTCT